jgi:hypothetical protein
MLCGYVDWTQYVLCWVLTSVWHVMWADTVCTMLGTHFSLACYVDWTQYVLCWVLTSVWHVMWTGHSMYVLCWVLTSVWELVLGASNVDTFHQFGLCMDLYLYFIYLFIS